MGQRDHALDGVRGLAALAVAFSHCNLAVTGLDVWGLTLANLNGHPPVDVVSRLAYLIFPGDAAVTLFFVLSGHVLWGSFSRSYRPSIAALPEYISARLFRLLPVAIVSAIPLGLLAGTLLPPIETAELVRTMLMLSTDTNGVLWSLQVEVVCSLALFALWLVVRGSTRRLLVALVVTFVALRIVKNPYLGFLPIFVAGALVSRAPAWLFGRRSLLVLGIAALVGTSLLMGHTMKARYGEAIGAFLIVAYIRDRQPRFLVSRAVHLLGQISYPFYLTHTVGLLLATRLLAETSVSDPLGRFAALAVVSLAVTLPLAWLIHKTVEMPAMRVRPRFRPASRSLPAELPAVATS